MREENIQINTMYEYRLYNYIFTVLFIHVRFLRCSHSLSCLKNIRHTCRYIRLSVTVSTFVSLRPIVIHISGFRLLSEDWSFSISHQRLVGVFGIRLQQTTFVLRRFFLKEKEQNTISCKINEWETHSCIEGLAIARHAIFHGAKKPPEEYSRFNTWSTRSLTHPWWGQALVCICLQETVMGVGKIPPLKIIKSFTTHHL